MKLVCQFCGDKNIIKWGKSRRKCKVCNKTFRVKKSGRKKSKLSEMYILDRSTFRRISKKTKYSHVGIIKNTIKEMANIPKLIEITKKFSFS
ncbi:TPA: hypothetical protein DCQ85_02730 [Candidatus Magasanikbacteria bacterium]|nr:MAG: hypothetical protein A2507_03960 [Candidatus Magasanikbacteria bacterium RIFOXYD12_FULL_33_17]HAO52359.1 hypothetical protein [Candidatus Magasanikbacteria bacterium]